MEKSEKFYVNSRLMNKRIPLDVVIPDNTFILRDFKEIREFSEGKYTDRVLGYSYDCVDTINFDPISVKIEGQKQPLISKDELQQAKNAGKRTFVRFDNATVLAYVNEQKHCVADSVKADDIQLTTFDLDF